jgi:hypothetical protein
MTRGRHRNATRSIGLIILAILLVGAGIFAYQYFFAATAVLDYIDIVGVHIGSVEHDWLWGPFGSSMWGCKLSGAVNRDYFRGVNDAGFAENRYMVDTSNNMKMWMFDPEDPVRCAPNLGVVVQYINRERLYGNVFLYRYKVAVIVSGSDILGGLPAAEKENYYKGTYFILHIKPPYVIENYFLDGRQYSPIYDKSGAVRLIIPVMAQAPGDSLLGIKNILGGPIAEWIRHATSDKGISKVYDVQFIIDEGKYVGTAATTIYAPTVTMTQGTTVIYRTATQYATMTVFKPVTTTIYVTEYQRVYVTTTAGRTVTVTTPVTFTQEIKVSGYKTVVETITRETTATIVEVKTVEVPVIPQELAETFKIAVIGVLILGGIALVIFGVRVAGARSRARRRGGGRRR